MNAAVLQADTLCFFLSADKQGGSRGPPRAGIVGSQLAGFGTATCDAGVPGISMVFGLPFDTLKLAVFFLRYHWQKREKHCVA